jgi:hypothetical protein
LFDAGRIGSGVWDLISGVSATKTKTNKPKTEFLFNAGKTNSHGKSESGSQNSHLGQVRRMRGRRRLLLLQWLS